MSYPPLPSNGEINWGNKFTTWADAIESGKVEGTGLSLRRDTTVGTRVFLDYPGGSTMLYGDTGLRNISELLTWGSGIVRLKRDNYTVHMSWTSVRKGEGPPAEFFTLPMAFRPSYPIYNAVIVDRDDLTKRNEIDIEANGVVSPATMSVLSDGRLQANLSWTTHRDWPTTLPGTLVTAP